MDSTASNGSEQRPYRIGQKVHVAYRDHDGEHHADAWITLVHPMLDGYEIVVNTGEPRTLNFHVPADGRDARIAPAA